MRQMGGKIMKLLLVLTALLLTMTGCLFTNSVSDLYSLPKMPEQYQELEQQIRDLISNGAEYAAPISGNNLQPVQMVDLNNDGLEEALIFMRDSASEKPLKIYIRLWARCSFRKKTSVITSFRRTKISKNFSEEKPIKSANFITE